MDLKTHTGGIVALGDMVADPRFAALAEAMRRVDGLPPLESEPERQSLAEAIAERRERALDWHMAHTPPVYRDARADRPAVVGWVERLLAGDESQRPSLLMLGTVGTGKTWQSYGALRLLAESGLRLFNPIAITAADLYDSLRPGAKDLDRATEVARYARAGVLLIDDLGSAKHSEFTEEITYRIVNHRYSNALPTLFTTNLKPEDIKVVLGDRTASRLAEMCEKVKFEGRDLRRAR